LPQVRHRIAGNGRPERWGACSARRCSDAAPRWPALPAGLRIGIRVLKLGFDSTFPVPFLHANHVFDQGCLAGGV